jgi:hypothetical protein
VPAVRAGRDGEQRDEGRVAERGEEDGVQSGVAPDGDAGEGGVDRQRVAEPGAVGAGAEPGQDGVQGAAVLEEVEEDEADREAVDEVGEEQEPLEQVAETQVELRTVAK